MINIFKQMEARLLHVIINDIIGNVFYARIVIQHEDRILEIDARPSDSVALAIRAGCPIYMHEKVYRDAAVVIGEEAESGETGEKTAGDEYQTDEDRSDLERLQQQLQRAIENENYEEAARLRDRIRDLKQGN
jgi:bifunctional DNase/RNase